MARPDFHPQPLRLLTENPVVVLERLRQGFIDSLEVVEDRFTDLHLLYALRSGLLDRCAAGFPDPRYASQVPIRVLLAASVAGAFKAEYALSQVGCALTSGTLLAELGLNAEWLQPGEGLSQRGTQEEAVFHADVLRKLLQQLAAVDREAKRPPGASLIDWWNATVGPAFQEQAGGGVGVWLLDATKVLVNLNNPRYEGSNTGKDADGRPIRGYKLGLLSTLIDEGRLLLRVGWDDVRAGDSAVTWPLVKASPPLEPGDTLLHDRGLIDGETVTCLKRDLRAEVLFPLKRDMLSFRLAVAKAQERRHTWKAHPRRKQQEYQKVEGIGGPWEQCAVPLNGCVVRERAPEHREAQPDGYRYWVFATTDLDLSGKRILATYDTRSECEEDHRQLKGENWEMDEFTSTSLVEILFHVLIVLFAYNLCQLYGLTEQGKAFAGKTKKARQRELRRRREREILVKAGAYYAVLPELDVHEVLIEAEGLPRERLRTVIRRQKAARKASE
jgi:hypothetical protein